MKSSVRGTSTSEVEVINVDTFGIWLLVQGKEYLLPYSEYPWFRDARIGDILNVAFLHEDHLHWSALDVDLCLESLQQPEGFRLIYDDRSATSKRRRPSHRA